MLQSQETQLTELCDMMSEFYADPLGHVLFSYPWGQPGPLEERKPDQWQVGYLVEWGQEIRARGFDGVNAVEPIRFSTASGHGIGKSAMVSWIIKFIMDTRPFCKGVVTATTAPQLRAKTWAELAKWHGMSVTKEWFILTFGSGSLSLYQKDFPETWRCEGQTCREENSEAFAGQHAVNSTSFYIFDEASGVPDKIAEVREGGLTDGEPHIHDFGNPTKNSGFFFRNMRGKTKHLYVKRFIDSRDVEQTNKALFRQWADDWGEDSDFFKVRVMGQFPDASSTQLIANSLVHDAMKRSVVTHPFDPLIMGVDVARFGHHRSVIACRQGRDFTVHPHRVYRQVDTMFLASEIVQWSNEIRPDAVMIDGGGVGGGVIDRCRQLGLDVIEINFGAKATMPGYFNMRAQMYGRLVEALKDNGPRFPDGKEGEELEADLCGIEYEWTANNDLKLESKENMERRGLESPDLGDAYALTYAQPVAPTRAGFEGVPYQQDSDYDPIS